MSYHTDTVGSYLRPEHVLEARRKKENSEISGEELRKVEDAAIKELVAKQVEAGLKVVTDGELRRDNFILDFLCGLNGVKVGTTTVFEEIGKIPKYVAEGMSGWLKLTVPYAYGKISSNPNHPEYSNFEYLKSVTPAGIIPKILIPSPLYLSVFRPKDDPYPKDVYSSADEFYDDISIAYKETLLAFYEKGVRVCFFLTFLI
jgi:methionine synthase II (cobalamin-independent)